MFFAMRLAKAGYCGGNPLRILELPVSIYASMMEYEFFEADYETEYIALNQPEN